MHSHDAASSSSSSSSSSHTQGEASSRIIFPLHSFDIWELGITILEVLSAKDLPAMAERESFSSGLESVRKDRRARNIYPLVERLDPKLTHYPRWPLISDLLG